MADADEIVIKIENTLCFLRESQIIHYLLFEILVSDGLRR